MISTNKIQDHSPLISSLISPLISELSSLDVNLKVSNHCKALEML